MKRYLIFAALGPLLGGFLLLVATTVMSGYWHQADCPKWQSSSWFFSRRFNTAICSASCPA